MNIFEFPDFIQRYAEAHSSPEDPVLEELYRKTYLRTVYPQMISGKVQGQLLSFISQMIRPEKILEVGTFTGYSAYCLAKGMTPSGKLFTIEVNEELEDMIRSFFRDAGIEDRVELIIGNALDVLPGLQEGFDLVFIDAHKENYPEYYEYCIRLMKPGGFLIADNVLWGGKTATVPPADNSARKLHEFNTLVQNDNRVENVFLTVRDGLMFVRKR